jgi:hypothetical protein
MLLQTLSYQAAEGGATLLAGMDAMKEKQLALMVQRTA